MSDREWKTMDDQEFETMLESNLSELPPDDIVRNVTPWKKSMNRVLIGMALTTVTLEFWYLNYIFPTIGIILLLLGFRALRHENKWFGISFIVSIIRVVYVLGILILNTTIILSTASISDILSVLKLADLVILLIGFICFWRGIVSVQLKAGVRPHAGEAVALIVWYAIMYVLAFVQYSGIIAVAMVFIYVFIIRSLYKLSKELDEAGYAIHLRPSKVTDRCIVIVLILTLGAGLACGYAFGGSYPMEWTKLNASEHDDVKEIESHLLSLGFPENVLSDLSAEDIVACEGALQVVFIITDEPINDGRTVITSVGSYTTSDTVYDVKELRITGVGVQIPGERERWIIIHHFLWTTDPGFYGTESIQLWPAYHDDGWHSDGEVTGRVLYDKNGQTYVSDYDSLGSQTYTSNDILWGDQRSRDVFATFSMPRDSDRQRGYVAYPIDEAQDGWIISSWFNYTHQRSWLQYPAMTAMEISIINGWPDAGVFKTIQDQLQFMPIEEHAE